MKREEVEELKGYIEKAGEKLGYTIDDMKKVIDNQGELELNRMTYVVVEADAIEKQQKIWREAFVMLLHDKNDS